MRQKQFAIEEIRVGKVESRLLRRAITALLAMTLL